MSPLQELFVVDSARTIRFFVEMMSDTIVRSGRNERCVRDEHLWYVASVLAHYAYVSWSHSVHSEMDLSKHLITSMSGSQEVSDTEILEAKGSHILLLSGFFRNQIQHRYSVESLDAIGRSYYLQAHGRSRDRKKRQFFEAFAEVFPFWTQTCGRLGKRLQEERYVVRFD